MIERVRWKDERMRLRRGKQRLVGVGGGLEDVVNSPGLLCVLDACVRAGGVEEFQDSG